MAVLVICVYLILKLTLVAGQPGAVHYVLKGREAFLSPGLPKAPDDILWKHNGDKVITFDSAEELVFPPYESRVTLAWDTAELTIADVGYEDSGEYELDAFIRDKLHRSQHMLKVLDKVSKPVIRCEMTDGSGNSTSVRGTLHCSSDSNTPEVLTFKWNLEGKSHLGQALSIALGDEHDHIEYSCTASNPLHAETSVFMAKDCLAEERSSKALDVIVPIVIASLILLAFCIFPFIFRHQIKRACFRREKSDDLEKHIGVADKSSSLKGDIHRQETFASKQPLIQQNDEASPQRQAEEGNDTDRVETVAAQPASPIRNGQVDSEGETDRDTHSDQTETQALLSKPDEHESRGKTDSTGVLDAHHSDREDVQKSEVTGDSSSIHSGQEEDTGAPGQAETLFQAHLQNSAPQEDALQFTNKELAESHEESEPTEPERKEQVSPDEDSPPAPEVKDPHNDLEKQITVAGPLKGDIHRQEPFRQQNDEASPQRQEIDKDLQELRSSENVKKRSMKFKNQEGNDTDHVETATSQPASPIRNGQVDSERETDYKAPKSEGDCDTDSDHSSNGSEQTETQALLSMPDEQVSKGQTGSTGVPDSDDSDHEDVQKSEVTGDSSSIHSGQEEDTGAPEQGLAESNEKSEPIEPESKEQLSVDEDSPSAPEDPLSNASHNENVNLDHTEAEESKQSSDSQMPPPHSELSESQLQSAYQHPADLEDREKTGPVEQTKPGPADKDPQGDSDHEGASSNNKAKKAEDAAPTDVLSSSPDSESQGLAESNEKSKPIEPESKEQLSPDEDSPSAPEDSLRDASHNKNVNLDHTKAEESKQSSDSQMPPPHSELSESQPQSAYQHPADLEDREKTGPVEQTKPGPADKDPQGDSDHEGASSNNKAKKAEDAAPTDVLSSSPDSESPVDGALSQSDQNQHSHSGPNIEEVRGDKESDSSTDSSSEESKESKQTSTTDITPTGEPEPELQSQSQTDSGGETGEALNTDAVDDSSSSHSDQEEATVTPEQAGLEKESAESTHPPASALSKRS